MVIVVSQQTSLCLCVIINPQKAVQKEGAMDWYLIFGWSSPIGIGIFLALLGLMIFLLSKADEISKRTKAFRKEKGI